MTPSSEQPVRSWGGRPAAWFTGLLVGGIGVSGLYLGATQAEGRVVALTVGAMCTAVGVMMLGATRARVPGWRRTDDGSWTLPLGGARGSLPLAALVITVFAGASAVGALAADRTGVRVLLVLLALAGAVLAAEMWRGWLRRPHLTLTPDRLVLRAPGRDAELAWEDVGTIDYAATGSRWAAVSVVAARDAASHRARTSRLLLSMDREPDPPGLEVRLGLVADAPALLRLLRAMHVAGRDGRRAMLARGLPSDSGL